MTLKLLAAIAAIACGVALVIKLSTGTLDSGQVAGIGIVLAAVAAVVTV